jgi:tetratricopeptide (TPR) repeat protein
LVRFPLLLSCLLFFGLPGVRAQEVVKSTPTVSPELAAKADELVGMLRDANDLLGKGDTNGALVKVNAVLQADPRSLAGYVLRGAIYSKEKQWAKAQGDYEAAHLISPHSPVVQFNLAEIHFVQKQYDAARPGFIALEVDHDSDLGDLASYKVFLCDLLAGHDAVAQQELDAFNKVGGNPSYYFANAAWNLVHHKPDDARDWLASANNIYAEEKNGFYAASLFDLGYLPLPPPPPSAAK